MTTPVSESGARGRVGLRWGVSVALGAAGGGDAAVRDVVRLAEAQQVTADGRIAMGQAGGHDMPAAESGRATWRAGSDWQAARQQRG